MAKDLSASLEDYLEAIYNIIKEKKVARVKDIAEELGVTMPAVTGALRHLKSLDFVSYTPYEYIELTDKGTELAKKILYRHVKIREFLMKILDIPAEQASQNACRVEHVIDDIVLMRLIKFMEFIENHPLIEENWIIKFREFYSQE